MSCEGTTHYNGSAATLLTAGSCIHSGGGTWNSYGVTYGWTGTAYSANYTFSSPNQTS
ncbi:hypothetical protein QT381_07170 [Galbitalea sp. SE-J8]|uniref:hypothetical protein n=1 Tax=Galbitalea sp. SE-J8 TaxID=3054952 RepID=UPI00259CC4D5|nr:hypothetical protein [Galbitalea sp. SE-J8]MDM4762785.1 hypothetical protein [Galbitalea sp. SE-J8]